MALSLEKQGLKIALFDQRSRQALLTPTSDGRTIAIASGNIPLLEKVGVWPMLAKTSGRIDSILVADALTKAQCHFQPDVTTPLGYVVDNHALRQALIEAIDANTVDFFNGSMFSQITTTPSGKRLHTSQGNYSGAILIGADGKHSAVRRAAGIASQWINYKRHAIVAVIAHSQPHNNKAFELFLPSGPLALLPMNGQRSALIWTWPSINAQKMQKLPIPLFIQALQSHLGDYLGELTLTSERLLYPLSAHYTTPCHANGVVLIADAAHSLHPIAGQGFNLGMRDIVTLAAHLCAQRERGLALGDARMLEAYDQQRRPDVHTMLQATHHLNGLFESQQPLVRLVRGLGLRAVEKTPALKHQFMNYATGLSGLLRAA